MYYPTSRYQHLLIFQKRCDISWLEESEDYLQRYCQMLVRIYKRLEDMAGGNPMLLLKTILTNLSKIKEKQL